MMKKKRCLLMCVVALWVFSGAGATALAAQSPQVPMAGLLPNFATADPLPMLHPIPDVSFDPNFLGAWSNFPSAATDKIIYLKNEQAVGNCTTTPCLPGYYKYNGTTWDPVLPITLTMEEFQSQVLPTGMPTTTVWGYKASGQVSDPYIGPVIVAKRYHPAAVDGPNGAPTAIIFVNNLPTGDTTGVLAWKYSTDQTMHWADPLNTESNDCTHKVATGGFPNLPGNVLGSTYPPPNDDPCALNYGGPIPAVVHLHGGEVPPMLDGGPDAWVTSDVLPPISGHGYYTFTQSQGEAAPGNYFQYNYPNTQEAANIWFHDHVLGITRLNVYAGMAGAYVIVDPVNPPPGDLAGLAGAAKIIPLVIQDRMFDTAGELFFPADSAGNVLWTTNPEHPYWVPEFLGDVIVVNGKVWPYLNVEQGRYRFLFLNGSNARTYEMWASDPVTGAKPPMWVIGTDGGYLDAPVPIKKLTIMPGERYDVIMDFSAIPPGTNLILKNNARTPFPKGVPPNGATVGQIMQFRVTNTNADGKKITNFNPAAALRTPVMQRLTTGGALPGAVDLTRQLTLNEVMGLPRNALDPVTGFLTPYPGGPLEVLLNNTKWSGERLEDSLNPGNPGIPGTGGYTTLDVALVPIPDSTAFPGASSVGKIYYTELPTEGDTEVWEIINITADAHPIHLHLVQFQIINRQNFDVGKYMNAYAAAFPGGVLAEAFGPPYNYSNSNNPDFCATLNCDGTGANPPLPTTVGGNPDINKLTIKGKPLYLSGKPSLALAEEAGWKDTVISYPGQVLRLAVRWAPTDSPAGSLYFPFNPDGGHGYVWHCHIIDHEDNEMMRPTQVQKLTIDRDLKEGQHY